MAGKRKREAVIVRRSLPTNADDEDRSNDKDVYRKYFESVFEPLPEIRTEVDDSNESSHGDLSEVEDEWEGFSEQEDPLPSTVQIIEHGTESAFDANPRSSTEFKAFMVC